MTHKQWLGVVLTSVLMAAGAPATAQDQSLKRVIPSGTDGDGNYFTATCQDGSAGSVKETEKQICAMSRTGKSRCRSNWTLMEAARFACKGAKR